MGCYFRRCDNGVESNATLVVKRVKASSNAEVTMEAAKNEC
jgi:hypothetical protein